MTLGKGGRKIESERKKNFKRRGQYVFLLQLVKHQNQERITTSEPKKFNLFSKV